MTQAEIINKINNDNKALRVEVEEFKNTEIAKKVTTLYEKNFDELKKKMEEKGSHKDIGSIYTNLMTRKDTEELAKRLLLDQAFFEETKQRVGDMARAGGVMAKIEEKASA